MRAFFSMVLVGVGWLSASSVLAQPVLTAVVSIPPQQFVLERIAGDRVEVMLLKAPGKSPVDATVNLSALRQLREADVIFTIGVGLEKAWLPKIERFADSAEVVDMGQGTQRFPMPAKQSTAGHHHHGHSHDGHDHAPGDADPHIWLSTDGMQAMADTTLSTLSRLDPEGAALYALAHEQLVGEIRALRQEISERLDATARYPVLMYHPSWYYFAREFGFEIIAIEQEGKEPSLAALQSTISRAKAEQVKTVFTQDEFSDRAAKIVADRLGIGTYTLSPLSQDWFASLRQATDAFAEAIYD